MTEVWEGAGVFSSYADLNKAFDAEQIDPMRVAFAAAGAGLDTLGVITNPLDSLLTAGIGWLIEHVDFLSDPLDALAGDPGEVLKQATAWHGVSTQLGTVAVEYRETVATVVGGWEGEAATAYATAVERCTVAVESTARDADQLSSLIAVTGALVGTVRALIRDAIAQFLSSVIQWVIAALAAAAVTAGFSLAALVAAVVQEAVSLARSFVRRISELLDLLGTAGTTAARLGDALRDTAADIATATRRITHEAGAVTDMSRQIDDAARQASGRVVPPDLQVGAAGVERVADRVRAAEVIETGKQATSAEQDRHEPPDQGVRSEAGTAG